jgi:hypothetical protein
MQGANTPKKMINLAGSDLQSASNFPHRRRITQARRKTGSLFTE